MNETFEKIVMPMMMAKAGGGTLRSRMRKVLTGWCSEENEIGGTDMVVL